MSNSQTRERNQTEAQHCMLMPRVDSTRLMNRRVNNLASEMNFEGKDVVALRGFYFCVGASRAHDEPHRTESLEKIAIRCDSGASVTHYCNSLQLQPITIREKMTVKCHVYFLCMFRTENCTVLYYTGTVQGYCNMNINFDIRAKVMCAPQGKKKLYLSVSFGR